MSLHIILGGPDADRTKYCFDVMQTIYQSGGGSYMIVPDQFSYAAEKTAAKRFGGLGLNNIEVLTFNRIVFRIRQKISLPDYITAAGREMLICRAVSLTTDGGSVFYGCSGMDGFVNVISELISEFKRYGVTPEILADEAETASNKALSDKLSDIAKIYGKYEELLDGRFSDSDNDLDVAAEYIRKNNVFAGMTVFFDGFSDFLPQNMRVVCEIIKNAADVYITLGIPENAAPNDDTFDTCRSTYSELKRFALENGIGAEDIPVPETTKRCGEIRFLLENFSNPSARYKEATDKISVFYAKNPYSETERAAAEIVRLVRDKGLRYRDVAVLCGSMDSYAHIIQSTFAAYQIPYFTDETTAVTDHPIITAVTAALDIIANDWRYDDVFRYLRAGFIYGRGENGEVAPLDSAYTDKLENYVLRWGIRGREQWLSEEKWKKRRADVFGEGGTDEIDEKLDEFRRRVTAPVENLRKKASGKNAAHKAAAFFEFLEEINMPDGIETEVNRLRARGYMDEAAQFEQVWELLVEAIEQIYVTMGENRCSMEDFARYMRAGLSRCEIRIIPSSLDHTAVGTIDRSRSADVRELFILGANFGMIPPDMNKEGILSNRDREELSQRLEKYGLCVAPDTKRRNVAERYKVYRSLCSAREGIHISYAAAGADDDTLRPSQFVADVERMFPLLKKSDDMITPADNVQSARSAFSALMLHLDDADDAWGAVRRYFEKQDGYREKIEHILSSCRAAAGISPKNAEALFGGKERSVTQFEKYAACPYSYFLRYGLQLREREVWEINGINIGNLCHRIVQQYCERVSEGLSSLSEIHSRWRYMTDEESARIINEIIDAETSKGLEKAVRGRGRLRSVLNRIRRVVCTSVRTINRSLADGEYAYSASEKEFSSEIGGARIRGFIDRVDIAESGGKAYIRIVDYKSGSQSFDITKIAAGLNLQLVTYAAAAVSIYKQHGFAPRQGGFKDVRIGGMLYNKIKDDIAKGDTVDEAVAERDKNRKMSGILFADAADEARLMDETLSGGVQSGFLPVAFDAKSNITKHSSCESSDMAEDMVRFTENCISRFERDILSGHIPVLPYRSKTMTPCMYCGFKEVCRFEKGTDGYRDTDMTKKDAEALIRGETREVE